MDNDDYLYWGNNSYQPSRFILRLDLPIELHSEKDEVYQNEYRMSLFVHEYIHFLQDISTRYGLMKASNYYSSTKSMAHTIRERGEMSFKVPQELNNRRVNDCIYQNYYVFSDYLGDGIIGEYKGKKITVLDYRIIQKYRHDVVYVKLDIEGVGVREVLLGGEILCESMAYLAEKNYADVHHIDIAQTHEYPYMLCGKLAEYIYPELSNDSYSLFLIIDQCLYRYFNPGPAFVQVIEYLKKNGYCSKSEQEKIMCLDAFWRHLKPELENYDSMVTEVIRQVKHCFQDPEFDATIKWLEVLYERCATFREYPYCFKGFMDKNKGLDSFASQIHLYALGQPIVLNDAYDGILQPPGNSFTLAETLNIHPEYFSAIFCLRNVFLNGSKGECLLKAFCFQSEKNTGDSLIDEYCDQPWLKYPISLADKKNLCPFAVIWKHWGLNDQCPKR